MSFPLTRSPLRYLRSWAPWYHCQTSAATASVRLCATGREESGVRFLQDVEDGELKLNYVVQYIRINVIYRMIYIFLWIILTNTGSLYCMKNGCLEIWWIGGVFTLKGCFRRSGCQRHHDSGRAVKNTLVVDCTTDLYGQYTETNHIKDSPLAKLYNLVVECNKPIFTPWPFSIYRGWFAKDGKPSARAYQAPQVPKAFFCYLDMWYSMNIWLMWIYTYPDLGDLGVETAVVIVCVFSHKF